MIFDKAENKSPLLGDSENKQPLMNGSGKKFMIPKLDTTRLSGANVQQSMKSPGASAFQGIKSSRRLLDLAEGLEMEMDGPPDMPTQEVDNKADFNQEFTTFQENTQLKTPFTMVQFEDIMYVRDSIVLSLQYIFYQNGQKTTLLKKQEFDCQVDENGKKHPIIGDDGDPISTNLGCENYQQDVVQDKDGKWLTFKKAKVHSMSCFNGGVSSYLDSEDIYEKNQPFQLMEANVSDEEIQKLREDAKQQNKSFDEQEFQNTAKEYALAEGLLSCFKTSDEGKLIKLSEISFSTEMPFAHTKDGNMVLIQSNDHQTISLTYFNPLVHEFKSRLEDASMQNAKQVFKVMAWKLTKENTLQPIANLDILSTAMCQYYETVKKSFFVFQEAKFMSGHKHVLLTYIEKLPKNKDYQKYQGDLSKKKFFNETRGKNKRAPKYVIFEVETGEIVLEWGGVYFDINMETGQYNTYHLGMLPIHRHGGNELAFFYGGKILDFVGQAEEQKEFDLTWTHVGILQSDLTSNKAENLGNILKMIENHKNMLSLDKTDIYRMKSAQFIYNQDWNTDVSISINKSTKKLAMLNLPFKGTEFNKRMYYVYEKLAQDKLDKRIAAYGLKSILGKDKYMPMCDKNIPREGYAKHGRNFQNKSDIYFMTIKPGGQGGTGFCMRSDEFGHELSKPNYQIIMKETEDPYSSIDVMLYEDKNTKLEDGEEEQEIIQSIIIKSGDQQILLKTMVPSNKKSVEIFKSSMSIQWQRASFPIIAYNLGIRKLVIMNQEDHKDPKQYILQLQEDESFICFVNFNDYEDFGFYPDAMRIYGCANVLYASRIGSKVHLNLLLFDPFYSNPEIALLRSTNFIDYTKFNCEGDLIYQAAMAPTKRFKGDLNFKIYVIIQHEHLIQKAQFIMSSDEDEDKSDDDNAAQFFDNDSGDDDIPILENVTMIQDKRNFIYYVVRIQGSCKIMEINPRDSALRNHQSIFEIKAERCIGLENTGDQFFIVDEFKTIHMLERILDSRELIFKKEFRIKQVSIPDFIPEEFEPMCITQKYAIYNGKIFYIYQDDPMPNGIYETEDLVRQQDLLNPQQLIQYKGPIEFNGSFQFFNAYKTGKFKCHLVIYEKPDSAQKTLINDFMRLVDISSFLDDGKIFVKCLRRFMMFTKDGSFIDEIDFQASETPAEMEEIRTILALNNLKTLLSHTNKQVSHQVFDDDGIEVEVEAKKGDNESPIPIKENNMRDLLQFSQNNKFFLFINRLTYKMSVYKLEYIWENPKAADSEDEEDEDTQGLSFQFQRVYTLGFIDCSIYEIFKDSPEYKNETLEFFLKTRVSFRVENSGAVAIILVRNEASKLICQVDVSIFSEKGEAALQGDYTTRVNTQSVGGVQNFRQEFKFDEKVIPLLISNFESQKQSIYDQMDKIKIKQDRQLEIEHDYSTVDLLEKQIASIENKIEYHLISAKVYGSMVVVWCGNLLKYAQIIKGKLQTFKNLDVDFQGTVEIQRVIATLQPDTLQIIAEDHIGDYMITMTWDFINNMELSMFQQDINGKENFASYIVSGMYQRLNYLVDPLYVYDLEFNVPYSRNTSQGADGESIVTQLQSIIKWQNQRKVFRDNSRFLDVQKPYLLNKSDTRMDLLFWDNVQTKGESVELLQQCMSLSQWSTMFKGKSLWHHYAGDSEMIQFMHDKYKQEVAYGTLSAYDHKIPLLLLAPDFEGYSGLYHAIKEESPKSFELMCSLLNDFDYICLSKMILKSLPVILGHESQPVYSYFESAFFKTNSMGNALFVPWQEDREEFVFACNTSIISQDLVTKKMGFKVLDKKVEQAVQLMMTKQKLSDKNKLKEAIQQAKDEKKANKVATHKRKSELKSKKLNAEFVNDQDDGRNINRVSVEACEFDWLFEGDNVETLITILVKSANPEVLTTQTIKMFIEYMWDIHYQKAIIYWIFLPYIVYLIFMYLLCSGAMGLFLDELNTKKIAETAGEDYQVNRIIVFKARFYTSVATSVFMMFAKLEMSSFFEEGLDYFSQAWNCLDFISISLNFSFLIIAIICQVFEIWVTSKETLRTIGAFGCFFMWCKMFYWMRLFKSTAYYVKLIQQTIADCLTFMLMVLIIVLAFANFFLIINLNMQGRDDELVYVSSYLGIETLDAIISAYFMGLGEFAYDGYSDGPNKYSAWAMFLLATFLTCVVFMNMLIAIMGETFGAVTEKSEQSGLNEQVNLINDHVWLLDLKKLFKNQRYLIRVSKSKNEDATEENVGDIIQTLENNLTNKNDRLHRVVLRRLETIDNMARQMQKNQNVQSSQIAKVQHSVKQTEQQLHEINEQKQIQ